MKIALVTSTFPMKTGDQPGIPAIWELAHALKKHQHEVLVCTIGVADQPELVRINVEGIDVCAARYDDEARKTCFDGAKTFDVFSWQLSRARLVATAFREVLADFKPDVIECPESHGIGFFLCAEQKYAVVVRCHGPMAHLMRNDHSAGFASGDIELVESLENSTMSAADGVLSMCKDLIAKLSPVIGQQIQFSAAPYSVSAVTPPENADTNQTLFFWGRVDKLKGADLLLESFIRLAPEFPKLRLVIAGQEMNGYGDEMRARLKQTNLADRATFRGFVSRQEIAEQVQKSTVCVFPSRYETACYAIFEALDYGGVVVATKVGGIPDYHEHGKSAWLVEPESVGALADGIRTVLTDAGTYHKLQTNGRSHIAAVCDPVGVAGQSVEAYKQAIERFKTKQPNVPFQIFANGLLKASFDKPLWELFPAQATQPPTTKAKLKGMLRHARKIVWTSQ
jgi:glycosyltransferase involved in cell wall biosynthesis